MNDTFRELDGSKCTKCAKPFRVGEMRCGLCRECLECHPDAKFAEHEKLFGRSEREGTPNATEATLCTYRIKSPLLFDRTVCGLTREQHGETGEPWEPHDFQPHGSVVPSGEATLQDRLRFRAKVYAHVNNGSESRLFVEAADALDAKDARIAELRAALADCARYSDQTNQRQQREIERLTADVASLEKAYAAATRRKSEEAVEYRKEGDGGSYVSPRSDEGGRPNA